MGRSSLEKQGWIRRSVKHGRAAVLPALLAWAITTSACTPQSQEEAPPSAPEVQSSVQQAGILAPSIDLDTSDVGNDYAGSYTEGNAHVPVCHNNSVVIAGFTTISQAQVVITNPENGGDETLSAIAMGDWSVNVNAGTHTLTVSNNGAGTLADLQDVLETVNYLNASDDPTAGDRVITVTVTGTTGGDAATASATATINVIAVNDPPSLTTNDGLTLDEGATGTITSAELEISDVDNDATEITYTVGTAPSNGTLRKNGAALAASDTFTQDDINQSRITYDHNGGENTSDSFSFTASDGNGGNIGSTTFSISVNAINDAPVLATNDGLIVAEGSTTNITSAALDVTDVDNNANEITYTVGTAPSNGTLRRNSSTLAANSTFTQDDLDNNRINYVHDGSETASDSFTFTVADGDGGSIVETTFNIVVNAVNDTPVLANNNGLTLDEGATGGIGNGALQVTDADNAAIEVVYTLSAVPSNGTLRKNNTALALNETFTQADVDGGLMTYVHNGGETTDDSFQFTVSDGAGGSIAETTFNIAVNAVNDTPVLANNGGITVNEGGSATINDELMVTDADNNTSEIVFTVEDAPSNGTLKRNAATLAANSTFTQADLNADRISYTHDGGEATSDSFSFTVSDGDGGSIAETTFNISINAVNDDPVLAVNDGLTLDEGATASLSAAELSITDADNNDTEIAYTLETAPGNGELRKNNVAMAANETFTQNDINNGSITYVHDGSETTSDSFVFSASDGAGGTIGNTTFSISVNAVNDAPALAQNNTLQVDEGQTVGITSAELLATDDDNAATEIVFTVSSVPSNGMLHKNGSALSNGDTFTQDDVNSGDIDYVHGGGQNNSDSFVFTVSDGDGGTIASTTFNITIGAVNDAPVLSAPGAQVVTQDQSLTIAGISAQDPDAGANDLEVTISVSNGTVDLTSTTGLSFSTGTGTGESSMVFTGSLSEINAALDDLTFDPSSGFAGAASVQIAIDDQGNVGDGGPLSDSETISVDVQPTISISDASHAEGDAGSATAELTVSLSASYNQTVTVGWSTADGTASRTSDYTESSGTLTFNPGETSKTISVAVSGDELDELDETFNVTLNNPTRATISDGTGVVTINDDDTARISINDVTVTEGNAGTTSATFTVSLETESDRTIAVDWATRNGTATTGDSDYNAASDTLSFSPGQTSKTVTVQVQGDEVREGDEDFFVDLSNPVGSTINDGTGEGTIQNDDAVSVSVSDGTVTEGDAGNTAMAFTVSLSNPSDAAVSVNWATQNSTATAGSDYVAGSDTLTFSPGQTSKTINVNVTGDAVDEQDEQFRINLSGLVGGDTIADGQGVGVIQDDDTSLVSINDITVAEGDAGNVAATFTVSLSTENDRAVSVSWATQADSASAGSDFTARSQTLSIAAGDTSETITVNVKGDRLDEDNEAFRVNLSNAVNASISDGTGEATITDDDFSPVATVGSAGVLEDDSVNGQMVATDGDNDALTFSVVNAPTKGSVVINDASTGAFTYTPNANAFGIDTFMFRASDGVNSSATTTFTLNITEINDNPIFDAVGAQSVNENQNLSFTVSATDVDNDSLTYNAVSLPDGAAFNAATGAFSWTPNYNQGGNNESAVFSVVDGRGGNDVLVVDITVNNTNRAPSINDLAGDQTGNEGSSFSYNATVVDLDNTNANANDNQTLTYTWDFGDGSSNVTGANLSSVNHTYAQDGTYTLTLSVTDGVATVTDTLSVVVANVAPVVDSGENQTVNEGDLVTLEGSFVDPGTEDNHTFRWTFGDGSAPFTGGVSTTHVYRDDSGNSPFQASLRVTDDDASVTDNVAITVRNVAPSVNAGNNQNGDEGDTFDFEGSFTDPGADDTHTIAWDFGDGSAPVTGDLTPSHTYTQEGVYTVTLSIIDDDGGEGTDTLTVTVDNVAPSVNAGNNVTRAEGQAVNFDATVDDPGNDTLTYTWNYGDGSAEVVGNNLNNPSHTYLEPGNYTVQLTVFDGRQSVTDTLTVTATNVAPQVTPIDHNNSVNEGSSLSMNVTATEPGTDQDDLHFAWDFGDGNTVDANGLNAVNHTFADEGSGSYTVTVMVDDGDGTVTTRTSTVTVNNVAPTANAGNNQSAQEGQLLSFAGTATDPGDDDLTYAWNFGDGNTASGQSATHAYADQGNYTVTLTVTDEDGASDTDTLTVSATNVAPSVDLGNNRSVAQGDRNTFTASVADPGLNENLMYNWSITCDQQAFPGCNDGETFHTDTSGLGLDDVDITFTVTGVYTLTLTVEDKDGAETTDTLEITVANEPPSVDLAVNNATIDEGDTAQFTGTVSDASGGALTVDLDYGDGETVNDINVAFPYTPVLRSHTYAQDGTYRVTLSAVDTDDEQADDTIFINVRNVAPAVTLQNQSANEGTQATLTANANDPGDDTLIYTWSFGDGSNNVVTTAGSVQHTYAQDGDYTLTLSVFDGTDTTTRTSTVTVANIEPTVLVNDTATGNEGSAVSFTVDATDPGDDTLTYTWTFGDGSDPLVTTNTTVSHTYADDNLYFAQVVVSDNTDTVARQVRVNIANVDPVVNPGNNVNAQEGDEITFNGSATDPGDDTLTYIWNFGDGSAPVQGVNLTNPAHTFTDDGSYTVTLTVNDEDGGSTARTLTATINNVAPQVNAGENIEGNEGTAVTFAGNATDAGADTLTYCWNYDDGSDEDCAVNLRAPNHTYVQEGTYNVTLTVTDDEGAETSDQLRVVIDNVAPTLNAGNNATINEGGSHTFAGTATDPGNDTLTYCWNYDDGSDEECGTNLRGPTHTFAQEGTYDVRLRVNDGTATVEDTVRITVDNVAPTINAGNNVTINEGDTYNFSGTATDPGADTLTYTWNFGDGTAPFTGNLTPSHLFRDNGDYTVRLTVFDGTATVNDTLTVTVVNVDPTVVAGTDQIIDEGDTVAFAGSATDPGADTLTYCWNFGDGSDEECGVNLTSPTHTYLDDPEGDDDDYTVTLTVTDDDGGETTDTLTVTTRNNAPSAEAGDNLTTNEGALVNFNGFATDPGADVLTYTWDFGDGTDPVEAVDLNNPTHTYTQNGVYTVVLTVTDDEGDSDTDTLRVTVNNVAPRLVVGPNQRVDEGETVTFSATGIDPGDDVLTYTWNFGDGSPEERVIGLTAPTHVYADNGSYDVTVMVEDEDGASAEGGLRIDVDNVAPRVVSSPPRFATQGVEYSYQLEVVDPSDDAIQYTLLVGPPGSSIDEDGLFTWTPDQFEGEFTVQLRVEDDDRGFVNHEWTISIGFDDRDGDGAPDSCEEMYVGLDPDNGDDGAEDLDGDGYTNAEECLLDRNPTVADVPTAPSIHSPVDGFIVETPEVVLTVNNSFDEDGSPISYTFELYSDAALSNSVEVRENIPEQRPRSSVTVNATLEENAVYWWRASAFADRGSSGYSDVSSFRYSIVNDPPTVPVPVSPMGRVVEEEPVFVVSNSSDPEEENILYSFRVYEGDAVPANEAETFAEMDNILPGETQTMWDRLGRSLAENSSYVWQARATDIRGLSSDWSDPVEIQRNTENAAPGAPAAILMPVDGEVLTDPADFQAVCTVAQDDDFDPLTYRFRLASEPNCVEESVVAMVEGLTHDEDGQISWKPDALELTEDTRYYLCADANDGTSYGAAAQISFVYSAANQAPGDVAIQSPANNEVVSTVTPSFVWINTTDEEEHAIRYALELYDDEAMGNLIIAVEDISPDNGAATTWVGPSLEDNTTYWWRVRAVDEEGAEGAWSEAARFVTNIRNEAPSVPVLLAPVATEAIEPSEEVVLTWENSVDPDAEDPNAPAISYTVEIYDAAGARVSTDEVAQDEGDSGMTSFNKGVMEPGRYDWRVRASDQDQSSAWSNSSFFRISVPAPSAEVGDDHPPVGRPEFPERDVPSVPKPIDDCTQVGAAAPASPSDVGFFMAFFLGMFAWLRRRKK